ncbi:MAG: hypothetical protein GVY36_11760 [Verrucomicrobia bacterium]|jgi:hypothetical protein|nr:hypothetical protein [Verrucomicrobiota bacterium]
MKMKHKKEITAFAVLALFAPWANAQNVTLDGVDVGDAPVIVDGTATVQDTLTVQAEPADPAFGINDDGAGVNPDIPDTLDDLINPMANTTPAYTQLGGATVSEESFENSGIIAETNGDLTLLSDQGENIDFNYIRAVRNDLNNFDQPNPGDTAQVINVGGFMFDPDSDPSTDNSFLVELGELDLAESWDPSFVGTDLEGELILDPTLDVRARLDSLSLGLTSEELDALEESIVVTSPIPGSGGNLQVGGNANVNGVLSLADAGPDNELGTADDGEIIVEDVGAAINGNADAIASEETARIDADNTLQSNIDAEETARIDADNTLQSNIDAEETARIDADNTLQSNIDAEVETRSALIRREEDGFVHIGGNSMIYDDVSSSTSDRLYSSKGELILGGNGTTDVTVDANLDVAGNASFQQDVNVAGDLFLNGRSVQGQLDSLDSRVDENARGIAMVAALQNSTVLPGMTNALDVGAAHFEGETGLSINYSRRINENVQLNFGAASTSDFDESVVRGGVGVQW